MAKFEDMFADLLGGESNQEELEPSEIPQEVQHVQEVQVVATSSKEQSKKNSESKSIKPTAKATGSSSTARKERMWKEPTHVYGKTQGNKGSAVQRINMGFTEENHDYLKVESRKRGLSITDFVNAVLTEYREGPDGYIYGK